MGGGECIRIPFATSPDPANQLDHACDSVGEFFFTFFLSRALGMLIHSATGYPKGGDGYGEGELLKRLWTGCVAILIHLDLGLLSHYLPPHPLDPTAARKSRLCRRPRIGAVCGGRNHCTRQDGEVRPQTPFFLYHTIPHTTYDLPTLLPLYKLCDRMSFP